METVLTINEADNGIIFKFGEYLEVIEFTHNVDKQGKDNLYQRLGQYLYNLTKGVMDEEATNKVQIEINITKAE